ncbi:hypothetical protein [Azospirillum sp. TSO35-2]|uniref:hypothetical protein n=1 Tax=Azospirillum sp. TSO35-2 TaxID=716796 RepID=UPI0011B6E5DF|nr:hypothetical protein [Azospirillum sp. TSO35-2]
MTHLQRTNAINDKVPARTVQPLARVDEHDHRRKVVTAWNEFDERYGRFADDWNHDFTPDGERRS